MGEVVSLADFRRTRAAGPGPAPPRAPLERLALAVRRLESALGEVSPFDEPELRRELVAVNGAVALGRYSTAASRTERLVARLCPE
ncbi:MAG TPA: hypothetical protein VID47_18985 [Actinomycetota bacterium]|jgi:hypothetical protein